MLHPTYFDGGMSLSFVHRRIFAGAKGFLTGGIVGATTGLLTGGGGGGTSGAEGRSGSAVVPSARSDVLPGVSLFQQGEAEITGQRRFNCEQRGLQLGTSGVCIDAGAFLPGGDPFISRATPVATGARGVVPMIGATATSPLRDTQEVRRCPGRGRVLGIDGLCYDKKSIRNDQRWWPPGRKPLLTGGDLNAIAKAARAAGRMKTQQKRLQKLGLLPKPKTKTTARRIMSGSTEHHHHGG